MSAAQAANLFVNVCVEQGRVSYPRWRTSLHSIVANLHGQPSEVAEKLDQNPHGREVYTLSILAVALLPVAEIFDARLAQTICSHVHHEIGASSLNIGPWVPSFVFDPMTIDSNAVDPLGIILSDMIDFMNINILLSDDGDNARGMRNHLLMFNMVGHFTGLPVTDFWKKTAASHKLTTD